jgi:hypothetical protein
VLSLYRSFGRNTKGVNLFLEIDGLSTPTEVSSM